jgi:predicted RNA-binding protein with PIN domain
MATRRRWLIDGMNLIGARPNGWWNDPDRAVRDLIDELTGFAAASGDGVAVVFDRRPPGATAGHYDCLEVAFASRRGRNAADHKIVDMVEADQDPASLTVVTSDAHLAERVRELGARVAGAGTFRRRLEHRNKA